MHHAYLHPSNNGFYYFLLCLLIIWCQLEGAFERVLLRSFILTITSGSASTIEHVAENILLCQPPSVFTLWPALGARWPQGWPRVLHEGSEDTANCSNRNHAFTSTLQNRLLETHSRDYSFKGEESFLCFKAWLLSVRSRRPEGLRAYSGGINNRFGRIRDQSELDSSAPG